MKPSTGHHEVEEGGLLPGPACDGCRNGRREGETRERISHLKTVAIDVEDQARALALCTEKLAFEVRFRAPMGLKAEWIELAPPGAQTCLVISPRSMMPDWVRRKPSVVFRCADAEPTHQELSARGMTFREPPRGMAWGTYASFAGPDQRAAHHVRPEAGPSPIPRRLAGRSRQTAAGARQARRRGKVVACGPRLVLSCDSETGGVGRDRRWRCV